MKTGFETAYGEDASLKESGVYVLNPKYIGYSFTVQLLSENGTTLGTAYAILTA